MSEEANIQAVRAAYASLDRNQSMRELADYCQPEYRAHFPGAENLDIGGMQGFGDSFFAACSNLTHNIESIFADEDNVALRLRITGLHDKPLVMPQGAIPASGNNVDFVSINLFKMKDGKALEHWAQFDMLGLMQQFGAMPAS